MKGSPKGSNLKREGLQLLAGILDSAVVREHPQFINAVAEGDDINVTVKPSSLGQPVTVQLHVVSAVLIPRRARRGRKG